jgi:hypothetical protein
LAQPFAISAPAQHKQNESTRLEDEESQQAVFGMNIGQAAAAAAAAEGSLAADAGATCHNYIQKARVWSRAPHLTTTEQIILDAARRINSARAKTLS